MAAARGAGIGNEAFANAVAMEEPLLWKKNEPPLEAARSVLGFSVHTVFASAPAVERRSLRPDVAIPSS
jgi:hypothetical protein